LERANGQLSTQVASLTSENATLRLQELEDRQLLQRQLLVIRGAPPPAPAGPPASLAEARRRELAGTILTRDQLREETARHVGVMLDDVSHARIALLETQLAEARQLLCERELAYDGHLDDTLRVAKAAELDLATRFASAQSASFQRDEVIALLRRDNVRLASRVEELEERLSASITSLQELQTLHEATVQQQVETAETALLAVERSSRAALREQTIDAARRADLRVEVAESARQTAEQRAAAAVAASKVSQRELAVLRDKLQREETRVSSVTEATRGQLADLVEEVAQLRGQLADAAAVRETAAAATTELKKKHSAAHRAWQGDRAELLAKIKRLEALCPRSSVGAYMRGHGS
jgi:AraC-like DNA-binding protein